MMTLSSRSRVLGVVAASIVVCAGGVGAAAGQVAETDLRLRTTATSFQVGSEGSYQLSVRNEGVRTTNDVIRVYSDLPDGLTFSRGTGAGWTCSGAGRSFECTTNTALAPDQTIGLVLYVIACDEAEPTVTTTFRVKYDGDPNLRNDSATRSTVVKPGTSCAVPPPGGEEPSLADLMLLMTGSSRVLVGGTVRYRIQVVNLYGETTNEPFRIIDNLPEGLSFVGASGDDWNCAASGQLLTCEHDGPLPVRGSTAVIVSASVSLAAFPTVTNYAVVEYAGDPRLRNNDASRPTTVRLSRSQRQERPQRPERPTRPARPARPLR